MNQDGNQHGNQHGTPPYPETINGLSMQRLDTRGDLVAWYQKKDGCYQEVTAQRAFVLAERLGLFFHSLGVETGDKVAIVASTRPEWLTVDAATLSLGAIVVGIYPSATAEQSVYILGHSEAKVAVLENPAQLQKVLPSLSSLPDLKVILMIEGTPEGLPPHIQGLTWKSAMQEGKALAKQNPGAYRSRALQVTPDHVATLVYTSGTTGNPKGAILTHRNFYQTVYAMKDTFKTKSEEVSLIFLPLAHVLQRFTMYLGMVVGGTGYFAESIEKIQENMAEVSPTVLATVPRVLEKIYTRVQATVAAAPPRRQKIFHKALEVGGRYHAYPAGKKRPLGLSVAYFLADRVVFSKIKARLGGRIDRMVSGGAPLAPHISEFFFQMGILVIEGYGLTETSAVATSNTPDAYRFGTVGRALPGVRVKLAEDGEILIQSPGNFQGYYKDPEGTAAALKDGWFYTGDIGTLDEDGFLKITDRKKDIIITSGGKNIAPQELENRLKQHPLISNVMLHGDKRHYLTALITLDEEEVRLMLGTEAQNPNTWPDNPQIKETIHKAVEAFNKTVAPYETIKKYQILGEDFSIDKGELTPTLKLKRKALTQKYWEILDAFYQA